MMQLQLSKPLQGPLGTMQLDLSLRIEAKSFVVLTGPSGSGKTTLLRILAGLESAQGEITMNGAIWQQGQNVLPPQQRNIGFMFQDYALFEHMSIEENLRFVANDPVLADELLEMTGLSALRQRRPQTLSGGQKQRVALCRALMRRPQLLLMDEPLSALDPTMRQQLQHDILLMHRNFGTTTIMVSHDPSEIYRMAERVIVLEYGKVVNDGSPKEVFLQTSGSQKFSFEGELLDIKAVDVIAIAVVAIGQQLVEVVLTPSEAAHFTPGQKVRVSTKAFMPTIQAL
jgi:molybdate transport system ATP-binding protein